MPNVEPVHTRRWGLASRWFVARCHAMRSAWRETNNKATVVIAGLTAINILFGLICSQRQLKILSQNSKLEYRPYVYVGVANSGTGELVEYASWQDQGSVVLARLDSSRWKVTVDAVVARNGGKGPAKEVHCGVYFSTSPTTNASLANQVHVMRFSLPPGEHVEKVYSDTGTNAEMSQVRAGAYAHLFAKYSDVSRSQYITDKVYALDTAESDGRPENERHLTVRYIESTIE
jgi:hypothetical protein